MSIRLFETPSSMFCEKVRIVLAQKNIPYESVDVRKDERRSLIEFSKQRKVPVMDFHGQCVIDSTVIAAFLEERYPENSIYPADPSAKGLCLMLEDWADEVLNCAVHEVRRAAQESAPEAIRKASDEIATHFRSLDLLLTGKQFIFERMTLADIAIFTQLHYLYHRVKSAVPETYRNLHAWMDLVRRTLKLKSIYDLC
ncbi:MAG TPA: glutathione S-transferase family protein [Candidatus Acidoferrales bacterium]|nr:glutathione S-transferase family protein [Candidatus Acidoferrales bacterium]